MIRNCNVCLKPFKTFPSKIKLGRGKYCSKECCLTVTNFVLEKNGGKTRFLKGQKAHNFIGKVVNYAGYIEISAPNHPFKNNHGRVKEHRLVMEEFLGRYLDPKEVVHHVNENKQDNRIENLQLVTHKEHFKLHGPLVLKRWAKRNEVVPNALHTK